tara:strand:+ start:380 stop:499 length:120 start_codon:yes stop_codon:yes gene_type:complete
MSARVSLFEIFHKRCTAQLHERVFGPYDKEAPSGVAVRV